MNFRVAAGLACAAAVAALAGCEAPAERTAEIQVVGNATIEKPAELFVVSIRIVERDQDRLAALAAASAKLDQITANIGSVPGLASYAIQSQEASATVVRPFGCGIGENYYGGEERPEDCSAIEVGALLNFTLEGAPADAAGAAIAYLTEAGVETVSLIGFDVADRAAAELEVKQAALANATTTAQALAGQAGIEITRPLVIRYGEETMFGRIEAEVRANEVMAIQFDSPGGPPAVELSLTPPPVFFFATVAVTFDVEDVGQE